MSARACNADNMRGVAGVADAETQLHTLPYKWFKGPEHMLTDTFQSFEGRVSCV